MTLERLLHGEWVDISKQVTRLSAKQLLELLRCEAKGLKRAYVMKRIYGAWRRKTNAEDLPVLGKGKLPRWLA